MHVVMEVDLYVIHFQNLSGWELVSIFVYFHSCHNGSRFPMLSNSYLHYDGGWFLFCNPLGMKNTYLLVSISVIGDPKPVAKPPPTPRARVAPQGRPGRTAAASPKHLPLPAVHLATAGSPHGCRDGGSEASIHASIYPPSFHPPISMPPWMASTTRCRSCGLPGGGSGPCPAGSSASPEPAPRRGAGAEIRRA